MSGVGVDKACSHSQPEWNGIPRYSLFSASRIKNLTRRYPAAPGFISNWRKFFATMSAVPGRAHQHESTASEDSRSIKEDDRVPSQNKNAGR